MYVTRVLSAVGCAVGLFAGGCYAQDTSKFSFNAGGGFTEPAYSTGGSYDMGFNIGVGGGYNFNPHLGLMAEFGFNQLGVNSTVLNAVGAPDGTNRIYSLTLDPMVRFHPHGRFDAYVIGGGGYYRQTVQFTEPAIQTVTGFDPFLGFFPVDVPTNLILGSATQNKAGLNIGGGVTYRIRGDSNLKFYAEARYHYLFTGPTRTTILPVTFGLRW